MQAAALKALPSVLPELDDGESETKKQIRDVLIRLVEQQEAVGAAVRAHSLSCLYLLTQHDLAMKFAFEQLLEQQLQQPEVYQFLAAHFRSSLHCDLQASYLADFALPALLKPLAFSDCADDAAAFDLVYCLLEKLEVFKTGECRVRHCLHRPKLLCSSAQTELTGSLPPLIRTDVCDSENVKGSSAVKRLLNICQVSLP